MKVDYSLYLVTDSTEPILGKRDFLPVVKAAIEGGVTVVQLREKARETDDFIRIAKELHKITKEHNIPLLINDNVDVALAVGCEGVHLGQDDMDIHSARMLLGNDAIIGVTASTREEAFKAALRGADYLGIGTVFATPTKENTKSIIGTAGVREILRYLASNSVTRNKPAVCIGGIDASNVQRVLYETRTGYRGLNGVAVVRAIMAAEDPAKAASELRHLIRGPTPFHTTRAAAELPDLLAAVPRIVKKLSDTKPLCHNMTNLVVQNFAANVALCIGASPIMSSNGTEAPDLAALHGALVLNMGTTTPDALANYTLALRAYNAAGNPVLLDPVGCGATSARRAALRALMASGHFDLIKGNEAEIGTVLGDAAQQRGVDSGATARTDAAKAGMVARLARRERCIAVMTGATDFLSDGERTYAVSNGHAFLGIVTGTGCTLGTTIAAYMAVQREDKLLAALAGMLHYEIAAEEAAAREDVRGPGTFVPGFLDELYRIREGTRDGRVEWVGKAKVRAVGTDGTSVDSFSTS